MFNIRKNQESVIFTAIKNESNGEVAAEITDHKQEDNPTWVKNTMKRLNEKFDASTVKKIRMNCQCGYGMDEKLSLLKELIATSSNLEEFANCEKAKAAGLSFSNGELFLMFPFCPCPMLADVEKLETKTWCQCTTGYSKVLFEKAFGCEVDVELLKSVKAGDDICLMKIIPYGVIKFKDQKN
jgi:predicted hydrocarbon binding protein